MSRVSCCTSGSMLSRISRMASAICVAAVMMMVYVHSSSVCLVCVTLNRCLTIMGPYMGHVSKGSSMVRCARRLKILKALEGSHRGPAQDGRRLQHPGSTLPEGRQPPLPRHDRAAGCVTSVHPHGAPIAEPGPGVQDQPFGVCHLCRMCR